MAQTQNIGIVCVYPCGAWNSTTAYKKLSLITYNNAAYIATQDNVGVEPSVSPNWSLYWMLLLNNPNPEEITVDTAMSAVSENPVQNKAIAAALAQKLSANGGTVDGNLIVTGNLFVQGMLSAINAFFSGLTTFNGNLQIDYFDENTVFINAETGMITGLIGTPVNDSDAANKAYVDEQIGDLTTATQAIIALQENYINGGNAS